MTHDTPAADTPAPDDDTLTAALARHAIALPPDQIAGIDRYCRSLWGWNEKINLTRHVDYETFVTRDIVDSLALSRHLPAEEDVMDVGTGGGVPGAILAITRPDITVSLCESVAKKARVLNEIAHESQLPCRVIHARAEDLLEQGETFDTLVMRGVAKMDKLLTWFNPHWGSIRRMLLIKGPAWVDERRVSREKNLIQHLDLRKLESYITPGTNAESVILQLQPKQA